MAFDINVENIKCGGCAGSIVAGLEKLEGVDAVVVDVEQGRVGISGDDALRPVVTARLQALGYPETGTAAGLTAAAAKARSYVSCAVGKFSESSKK